MEIIYAIITLASIIAAIIGWSAKIKWAKEYAAAKDEIIRAREAQIQGLQQEVSRLKDQTPKELVEQARIVREELTETIKHKENALLQKSETDDKLFIRLAISVAAMLEALNPSQNIIEKIPIPSLLILRDLVFFVASQEHRTNRARSDYLGNVCIGLLDAAERKASKTGESISFAEYCAQIRPQNSRFFHELPEILDQGKIRNMLKMDFADSSA